MRPATVVSPPIPICVPQASNDPAYGNISLVRGYAITLQSLLVGDPDRGVDWDVLQSAVAGKGTNGISFLASLLDSAKRGFKPSAEAQSRILEYVFSEVGKVSASYIVYLRRSLLHTNRSHVVDALWLTCD